MLNKKKKNKVNHRHKYTGEWCLLFGFPRKYQYNHRVFRKCSLNYNVNKFVTRNTRVPTYYNRFFFKKHHDG